MINTTKSRHMRRRTALAALALIVPVTLAACGSDDDGDSAGTTPAGTEAPADTTATTDAAPEETIAPDETTAEDTTPEATEPADDPQQVAADAVAAISGPLEWTPPGPAYTVDLEAVNGRTVYLIANALGEPYWQDILANLTAAGSEVGIEVIGVDGQGNPAEVARLVQQATAQDALAIIMGSIPTEMAAEPIKAATDAGVIVVSNDHNGLSEADKAAGVFSNTANCFECAGKEMAEMAVAQHGSGINAVLIRVPELGPSEAAGAEAFKSRLAELCPDCTVEEREAPLAQWGTALPSIGAAIAADDSVNVVVPLLDAMVALLRPSLQAASHDVSVISFNASPPAMNMLAAGELVTGLTGAPGNWAGWFLMDQVLRAASGADPAEGPISPNRAFTADNIGDIDLNTPPNTWFSSTDLPAVYSEYWGL